MSERGKGEDACASRAKPRLEERVCERGRRSTRELAADTSDSRRAKRRARPRASVAAETRVHFIHLNHTNRLLWDVDAVARVETRGFRVARDGDTFPL